MVKEKPIGRITHYFSEIKVAVIKLLAPLSEGDKIRVIGGEDTDFKQTIKSIQIDHEKVKKAKKGGDIGKKGKGFKKVVAAAKKGGAKDPEAVAAAAMWKQAGKK